MKQIISSYSNVVIAVSGSKVIHHMYAHNNFEIISMTFSLIRHSVFFFATNTDSDSSVGGTR